MCETSAPEKEPAWMKTITTHLTQISEDIKQMDKKLSDIATTANYAIDTAQEAMVKCEEAKKDIEKVITDIEKVRTENIILKKNVCELNAKIVNFETQSRRNNLIFCGIEEQENETWKDCEDKLSIILKAIGIENINFERVHRLGIKESRSRNIIAKFTYYKDREAVWAARFKLAGTNKWIMEDFPEEVMAKRKALYPAFKAAQRSTEINKVSMKVDKLCIDGRLFTVDEIHKLPSFLQPDKTAVISTDDAVVFFTKSAIFSNLHPLPIYIDGVNYSCNEHYFQHSKALMFKDFETASKIKSSTDPYEMMQLAKTIKGYKHSQWMQHAKQILKRANEAKYSQNEAARDALLATGGKQIGEASTNKFYGIGLGLFSKKATDTSAWTGKNLMGTILTEIRDSYQTSSEF